MVKGSHPIHRKLLNHWIWKKKPFGWGQAWIDLILLANHTDSKAVIEGDIKIIKRGQVYRSQIVLAERWGWSRKRINVFLKLLNKDKMLTHQGVQHGTIITLCNYSELHETAFDRVTPNVAPKGIAKGHQRDTKGSTYNNDKNDNNEKNDSNKPKSTKLSNEDFFKSLKSSPAYKGIDIDRELSKMDVWITNNPGRQKTRKFVTNWLNKIDAPLEVKKQPTLRSDKPYVKPEYRK